MKELATINDPSRTGTVEKVRILLGAIRRGAIKCRCGARATVIRGTSADFFGMCNGCKTGRSVEQRWADVLRRRRQFRNG